MKRVLAFGLTQLCAWVLLVTISTPVLCLAQDKGRTLEKQSSDARRPEFSWDHVPLYMHVRKATDFTKEELKYLASFPLITLEKTTGSRTHGSTEAGSRFAAKAIKEINPNACVLYYRNVMVNYPTYQVNEDLKSLPGAFLLSHDGNAKLHRNRKSRS